MYFHSFATTLAVVATLFVSVAGHPLPSPDDGSTIKNDDAPPTLVAITFLDSLNWAFVSSNPAARDQIENLMPGIIDYAVGVSCIGQGVAQSGSATIFRVLVNSSSIEPLQAQILSPMSAFYDNADPASRELASKVDISHPILVEPDPPTEGPPPGTSTVPPTSTETPPPGTSELPPSTTNAPPPGTSTVPPSGSSTEAPPGTSEVPPSTTDAPPPGTSTVPPSTTEAPPPGTSELPPSTTDAPPPGTSEFPPSSTEAPPGTSEVPPSTIEAPPPGTSELPPSSTEAAPPGTSEIPPSLSSEDPQPSSHLPVAGNVVINTSTDFDIASAASSFVDNSNTIDKWAPIIVGLLVTNLIIVLALAIHNIVARYYGGSNSRSIRRSGMHSGFDSYEPVHRKDHDVDTYTPPFKDYDSLSFGHSLMSL
ncbi:hypothetical protein DL96DRAFT_1742254 [Flagelloscypha sp. PMI_526]|nr:hypothetical protein DL96DRAFT_1742254 [Flagelloscypha sp. PMI_526]